jgi:hypothetical protein
VTWQNCYFAYCQRKKACKYVPCRIGQKEKTRHQLKYALKDIPYYLKLFPNWQQLTHNERLSLQKQHIEELHAKDKVFIDELIETMSYECKVMKIC